jgi:ankyrin repeat protein
MRRERGGLRPAVFVRPRTPAGRYARIVRTGTCAIALSIAAATVAAADGDLRLVDAARRQDHKALRALLKQRVDVNTPHPDGATAIHWAAYWDDLDSAMLLIGAGAHVNAVNDFGVTPLSLACTNRNTAMVDALLKAGANPNSAQGSGETVLMTCAWAGDPQSVGQLIARGADVNARESSYEQTALMWAAAEKHASVVRVLVENGAEVNARSKAGFSPLLFSARVGDIESARILLAAGANVNDTDAATNASALVVATVRGHAGLAAFLLDHGANPNANGGGYTALHWAAGSWETALTGQSGIMAEPGHEWSMLAGLPAPAKLELVKALLAHGADPNARIVKPPPRVGSSRSTDGVKLVGATPFFLATLAADIGVMRLLAAHGADTTLGTDDNTTPVMAAAGFGRIVGESFVTEEKALEALALALQLGGDINAANNDGDTALHGAARIRSNATVQFLVEKGATINVKNHKSETPLAIAERASVAIPLQSQYFDNRAVKGMSTGDLLRKLGADPLIR